MFATHAREHRRSGRKEHAGQIHHAQTEIRQICKHNATSNHVTCFGMAWARLPVIQDGVAPWGYRTLRHMFFHFSLKCDFSLNSVRKLFHGASSRDLTSRCFLSSNARQEIVHIGTIDMHAHQTQREESQPLTLLSKLRYAAAYAKQDCPAALSVCGVNVTPTLA